MLPLVRRIVADLVQLNATIESQRQQLREIDTMTDRIDQPNYQEEIRDMRRSLVEDEARLAACLAELRLLGVESHEPIDGFVDFPAQLNRRSVRLCWHSAEETVSHWHEVGDCSNRKRIDSDLFEGDALTN